ncbi:MAG: hypothetical protein R2705_02175 [Ilumatobacteraceae bacterium]
MAGAVCHATAHILTNENGTTSLLSGGAQLLPIPGGLSKLAPDALAAYLDATPWGDPHNPQPAVVSVTQPTDYGELYTPPTSANSTRSASGTGCDSISTAPGSPTPSPRSAARRPRRRGRPASR